MADITLLNLLVRIVLVLDFAFEFKWFLLLLNAYAAATAMEIIKLLPSC